MIVFGFGIIEEETAISIIRECAEAIKNTDKNHKKELYEVEKKYYALGEKYKTMKKDEAPERYSYFYSSYYEMFPGNCVIVFQFHHINRRHPFSGDGWAMLETRWVLSIDKHDNDVSVYKQV